MFCAVIILIPRNSWNSHWNQQQSWKVKAAALHWSWNDATFSLRGSNSGILSSGSATYLYDKRKQLLETRPALNKLHWMSLLWTEAQWFKIRRQGSLFHYCQGMFSGCVLMIHGNTRESASIKDLPRVCVLLKDVGTIVCGRPILLIKAPKLFKFLTSTKLCCSTRRLCTPSCMKYRRQIRRKLHWCVFVKMNVCYTSDKKLNDLK